MAVDHRRTVATICGVEPELGVGRVLQGDGVTVISGVMGLVEAVAALAVLTAGRCARHLGGVWELSAWEGCCEVVE